MPRGSTVHIRCHTPNTGIALKFHQETASSWSTPLLHCSAEMLQHQRKNKEKKTPKKQPSSLSVSEVKEVQNKAQRAKNKLKR